MRQARHRKVRTFQQRPNEVLTLEDRFLFRDKRDGNNGFAILVLKPERKFGFVAERAGNDCVDRQISEGTLCS